MDKVSLVDIEDKSIVVNGCLLYGGSVETYIDIIANVFKWQHQDHTYGKDLKKIPIRKKGEK